MRKRSSLHVATCDEHDRLLEICLKARDVLAQRREEVRNTRLTGVDVGRELLALQAQFAKTYNRLWGHTQQCACCRARIASLNSHLSGRLHWPFYDRVPA